MSDATDATFLDFQVNPSALHERRTVRQTRTVLKPGQVRFAVDRFAFTANNVTYATAGSVLGYLDFFPMDDGNDPWRRIPVMGHGEIVESAHPNIAQGGRYFGFFPMAGEHVITAELRGTGVWDAAAHRERHAPTYRQFEDVRRDPYYDRSREDVVALLRGLFITSFLVEDFLHDNAHFGAATTLVTSASSKTSIALGFCLRERGTPSIGLTSARHLDAVRGLGCYDRVVGYDELDTLDASVPAVVVDMAGNGEVIGRIHSYFSGNLRYSCAVGATHREAVPRASDLPGPQPQFFFAPSQIQKRSTDWGPAELMARLGRSFQAFAGFAEAWLAIVECIGPDAVDRGYAEVLDGASEPTRGLIFSLSTGQRDS